MNESKLYYNYAHIFDDRVIINTGLSMGNGGYDHKKTEYYYDEKCRLHQVIEHASLAYTENDNGYDLKNYTSVSWLRLGEYKDIEVQKEYDTEFNPKNNGLRL